MTKSLEGIKEEVVELNNKRLGFEDEMKPIKEDMKAVQNKMKNIIEEMVFKADTISDLEEVLQEFGIIPDTRLINMGYDAKTGTPNDDNIEWCDVLASYAKKIFAKVKKGE